MFLQVSVCPQGGCLVPGGVPGPGGVCSWGVSALGGLLKGVPGPAGVCSGGVSGLGGYLVPVGPGQGGLVSQHALRQTPSPERDGYCCGRYASYWNAFLLCFISFFIMFTTPLPTPRQTNNLTRWYPCGIEWSSALHDCITFSCLSTLWFWGEMELCFTAPTPKKQPNGSKTDFSIWSKMATPLKITKCYTIFYSRILLSLTKALLAKNQKDKPFQNFNDNPFTSFIPSGQFLH